MKIKIYFILALFLAFMSCKDQNNHNHEGHNHEAIEINHEGHDHENHEGHKHDGHNHETEEINHKGHNHEDHEGHNHESPEHEGHDHETKTTSQNADAHDHSDVKLQITAYSDAFEVFAEADPFSKNETSSILAHFTWLDNFKPLTHGHITAQLSVNGHIVEAIQASPLRDGIYQFHITPQENGQGKLSFIINNHGNTYTIESDILSIFNDKDEAAHWAMDREQTGINTTVFTKEQSWKIEFETEMPIVEKFSSIIKTTAHIQPCIAGETIIVSKANGIVDLQSNHITEGMEIHKGDKLFVVSGSELANNNSSVRYIEAKSNYEKADLDYKRMKDLAQDRLVTTKELLEAKNTYESSKAIFENLEKNFNSHGQVIYSSIDGFINRIYVSNGQYVEAGIPLVSISKNERLVLNADVQQKYASILPTIKTANIKSIHNKKVYSLEELNGEILSYGKTTNPDNYMLPITLEVDNTDDFVSGGFVEVYLKAESGLASITISNSALLEEQGNFFVFVQKTPELFEKREVKKGVSDG
ncbi:MAG: efflux RND transporter periplasmic adaptor subunit, partial [Bacteroidales bacterium]|nr:efflux RND transporter periplasmic adaptor subunit [Bacteroidales bacterium]